MTARNGRRAAPPDFPEEYSEEDRRRLLLPMRTPSYWLRNDAGRTIRKRETEGDPLRFALTYLSHHLRHPVTGQLSFSPMHIDLARRAQAWMEPGPVREATIAPRKTMKSTVKFLINPLFGLAHGWHRFLMAFSYTDGQAKVHLGNIVRELLENQWLRHDYPHLIPRQRSGTRVVTAGGQTLAARGLGASVLGDRSGPDRPSLLLGDDLEPGESRYGPRVKDQILAKLRQDIFPMNEDAVILLTGTVTKTGSVAHDLVNAARGRGTAPWIAEERIDCSYWPPILDEGTDRERSLWPQWKTLAQLHRDRGTKTYALNMANDPELVPGIGYWTKDLIQHNPRFKSDHRVVYIDPHMGSEKTTRTDKTAIVMVARCGNQAVVEFAEHGEYHGTELENKIFRLHERVGDTLREVWVEKNQGGLWWRTNILKTMPPGVTLRLDTAEGRKVGRIEAALSHYQRGAVVHAREFPELERQQLEWTPSTDGHAVDDLLDALAGALRQLFPGKGAA